MKLLLFILVFSFTFASYGKRFSTSYVSFELLNNWHCYPEGTEWICSNKLNRKKASEAVIILTAKEKGPADNLSQYLKHLKTPREVSSRGSKVKSKIFHAKQRQINKHLWVDGFHQGSEVPSYYTRYLITTKNKMAVLVTYSAHKNHYNKYASDFAKSISSLRLQNTGKLSGLGGKGKKMGAGSFQDYMEGMIDSDEELAAGEQGESSGGGLEDLIQNPAVLGGALGGAGLLSYLLFKRRRRGGGGSLPDRDRDRSSRRRRSSSNRHRRR